MPDPLIYLNGQFVPTTEATLSPFDGGLVAGVTVTDFCRTYNRRLFRHRHHVERFQRDCAACFIPLQSQADDLVAIGQQLIEHNAALLDSTDELALVTFATPGPLSFYSGVSGANGPPTLVMHTVPLPASRYQKFHDEGVSLAIAGHHAVHPDDLAPPRHKHRSRLHWWRADQLLHAHGNWHPGTLAVLLDGPGGCITETAIGNLLVVHDNEVRTPPVGWTLDSVSLAVVREICTTLQIPFSEQRLIPNDCSTADEMILTGSGFGVAGVRRFNGTEFDWPGPLTTRLIREWQQRVHHETSGP